MGGKRSSSVGPERILAKDMGSAALVGFDSFGGEAGLGGSRIIEYPGALFPTIEYGESVSLLVGDCE